MSNDEVWADLQKIIDTAENAEVNINDDAILVMMDVIILNQALGYVTNRLFKMGMGHATQFDVASALCKVITHGFVCLSRLVPDAPEYWEINLRELTVHMENMEQ